jgi:hypothetical protein
MSWAGLGPRPAVAGGVGNGEDLGSRKSGNDDELSRASGSIASSDGLCCAEGARTGLVGRAACLLKSFASRRGSFGRGGEALESRPSSGSECCWAVLLCLVRGDPAVSVLLLPTFAVCTLSEMMSSMGRGFRACAIANGPA